MCQLVVDLRKQIYNAYFITDISNHDCICIPRVLIKVL